jgi:hypothetical protein
MKHPRVRIAKLGKNKAWGLYDGVIHIDPRTKGKARLEVLTHEYFHHLWPDMPEQEVTDKAARLSDFLHRQNVRIIEPEKKSLKELNESRSRILPA